MDKTKFDISTDGTVVWVNAEKCLGRFCRFGMEIFARERGGMSFCAGAVHTPTSESTQEDWAIFVQQMKSIHDIDVPEKWMPRRLKEGIVELSGTAVGKAKVHASER